MESYLLIIIGVVAVVFLILIGYLVDKKLKKSKQKEKAEEQSNQEVDDFFSNIPSTNTTGNEENNTLQVENQEPTFAQEDINQISQDAIMPQIEEVNEVPEIQEEVPVMPEPIEETVNLQQPSLEEVKEEPKMQEEVSTMPESISPVEGVIENTEASVFPTADANISNEQDVIAGMPMFQKEDSEQLEEPSIVEDEPIESNAVSEESTIPEEEIIEPVNSEKENVFEKTEEKVEEENTSEKSDEDLWKF